VNIITKTENINVFTKTSQPLCTRLGLKIGIGLEFTRLVIELWLGLVLA